MQADGQLPPAQRRNYSNAFSALVRISKEEGVTALWRGSQPTVARAMAMNVGMLATHSQAKEMLHGYFGDGYITKFASSAIAGVTAACVTLPFDLIKTRIQQMQPDATGKLPYSGIFDCATKITTHEGVFSLWKGLGTFCVRVAPHAVITLMVMDTLNENYGVWRKQFPK
jgi:solute carrier family 25 oxoglutarate transporter 11